jgi:acyl-coenzyme A synthetase/AMP-(fatty) acid ligase
MANGLLALGLDRLEWVLIYLHKTIEHDTAMVATIDAGGTCVPVNPLLKPEQVRTF